MPEKPTTTATLTLDGVEEAVLLFGSRDVYLRMVRDALGVRLVARGDALTIDGDEAAVNQAERVFGQLRAMLKQHGQLQPEEVRRVIEVVQFAGERVSPQTLAVREGG